MRFVNRILIGVAAATAVATGAPAAASATTTATASATGSTSYEADWGAYHSADHKATAKGHVSVEKKKYKDWYWKTYWVKKRVCWKDADGDKKCKWVSQKVKKHKWVWKYEDVFTVHSKLSNDKWWGKNKCAWEVFKVVTTGGDTYFKRFKNCHKFPKHFSFSGKDAAHIYVDVSRGRPWGPTGEHSGWQDVYHAV
ncbi:hypothetical protein [Nonomuraea sp. SBT364]|uniref:hypothetical protein n=1 Tax=Nonomuraea sp. SBT364 TaxID=1580530 RepID=UPI00066C3FCA|nr:hypothetical protein [Nonomuraea sp. SBT364]